MIKFPSIEQYRNAIHNVKHKAQFDGVDENGDPKYNKAATLPKLKYRGTVKLHGTNAGVVWTHGTNELTFQSRERELTITSDNAGFAMHMSQGEVKDTVLEMIDEYVRRDGNDIPNKVAIFGEWCGGNIQSSVAINGLPKMFVIFAVKFIYGTNESPDTRWLDLDLHKDVCLAENGIYCILNFPSYEVEIDFERPEEAQNIMVEITNKVEAECPVGKAFGKEGVGEGVVWTPVTPGWYSSAYWFKVKGDKHSASKVKVLAAVDIEVIRVLNDFVDMAVTEARLEQGLQNLVNEQLKPFDMTSMGDYIRWVFNDVMKEEADTVIANQLDVKKLGGPIANKARKWYIEKFNSKG